MVPGHTRVSGDWPSAGRESPLPVLRAPRCLTQSPHPLSSWRGGPGCPCPACPVPPLPRSPGFPSKWRISQSHRVAHSLPRAHRTGLMATAGARGPAHPPTPPPEKGRLRAAEQGMEPGGPSCCPGWVPCARHPPALPGGAPSLAARNCPVQKAPFASRDLHNANGTAPQGLRNRCWDTRGTQRAAAVPRAPEPPAGVGVRSHVALGHRLPGLRKDRPGACCPDTVA